MNAPAVLDSETAPIGLARADHWSKIGVLSHKNLAPCWPKNRPQSAGNCYVVHSGETYALDFSEYLPQEIVYTNTSSSNIAFEKIWGSEQLSSPVHKLMTQYIGWTSSPMRSCTFATIAEAEGTTSSLEALWLVTIEAFEPLAGYERYSLPNWDGYEANPITRETLAAARKFLKLLPSALGTPDIAPGTDGTIGFEWIFQDRPLRKIFIDIGPGEVWSGYWRRTSGETKTFPITPINFDTALVLAALLNELNA